MKRILTIVAGLLAASASAQYAVSWYKVAGGGGTVSNGNTPWVGPSASTMRVEH